MDPNILCMTAALVISIALTGVLIPKILLISFRKNLFDVPDERKIHKMPVPRLGGIAFMPSIFFTIAALIGVNRLMLSSFSVPYYMFSPVNICFGMCAVMVVYLVGIADDLIGVKYRAKFVAQVIAALFVVSTGTWIHNLDGFMGFYQLPASVGVPLSVVVIVFIMNAINLIDGIDGLASGLSAIAFLLFAVVFYAIGQIVYALVCASALGTLIPFYYYNVFGDARVSKKIFMGDTGSLTVGLIVSFMALQLCNSTLPSLWASDSFAIAFAPLIVPCFDVVRVFGNRIIRHRNPFNPDKTHIHHKLMACGLPQRTAMIIILLISSSLTAVNIILAPGLNITWLVAVDLGLVLGINQVLNAVANKRNAPQAETDTVSERTEPWWRLSRRSIL